MTRHIEASICAMKGFHHSAPVRSAAAVAEPGGGG